MQAARRLGVGMLIALMALGVAEAALRLARFEYRRPDPILIVPLWATAEQSQRERLHAMYRFHPYWFWESRPGARVVGCETERINAAGYRGPERPLVPSAGKVRIVLLGDSIAFGMGVCWEQTYAALLERELPNVEVLNFGVIGFSAFQGEKLFEAHALAYDPQVVLVAFGAVDEWLPASGQDVEAKFAATSRITPAAARWYDRLSALRTFQLVDRALGRTPDRALEARAREAWTSFAQGSPEYLRNQSVASFERSLERIVGRGRFHGARVVLIGPPRQRRVEARWPWSIDYTLAIERVAARVRAPYLDVRAAFRAVPDSDDRLFLDDYHPNAAGHQLYARILAERLRGDLGRVAGEASGPESRRSDTR